MQIGKCYNMTVRGVMKMKNIYNSTQYLHYLFTDCISLITEGVKPSGLLTVWKYHIPGIRLESYLFDSKGFLKDGISYEILKETSLYYLLFFYQKDMLIHKIKEYEASELLIGYPVEESLSQMLHFLKKRIQQFHLKGKDFPHEIGIFLGYPIWDVEEFIKHKGQDYKLCGYWKVYQDVEGAKKKFKEYDTIRTSAIREYCDEVKRNNHIK